MAGLAGGDVIGQGHAQPEERNHEAEAAAGPDRAGVELLTSEDTRVPFGGVAEGGQVGECFCGRAV